MQCPSCKHTRLEAAELESGLLAAQCHTCDGSLLPLMNYRFWLSQQDASPAVTDADIEIVDSDKAAICPKCSGIMLKYRMDLEADNKVDFCKQCDEVWLDKGEWPLLKSLSLYDKLALIASEEWQTALRKQQQKQHLDAHYAGLLGDADFQRVSEFKQWLDRHEQRAAVMQYLTIKDDV